MHVHGEVELTGSITQFQTAAINVTAVAVELTAGVIDRKQLIIYPPSAGVIYWGASNAVTGASGAPLAAGSDPIEFDFAPGSTAKVWAVNDGTNRDIRVVESK